jgi:hypothetical protein
MSKPRRKTRTPKRVLALPHLEQSKAAGLNSLTSKSDQRTYDRAIKRVSTLFAREKAKVKSTEEGRENALAGLDRFEPTTRIGSIHDLFRLAQTLMYD